jgi:hypothetical protein
VGRRVEAWTLELRTSNRIKSFSGGTTTAVVEEDDDGDDVDVASELLEVWCAGVLGGEGRVLA